MLTIESLRATVAAGEVPTLPIKTTEVRLILATVMRELMAQELITVAEAARRVGIRDNKLASKLAREHGLRTSPAAMAAFAARGHAAQAAKAAKHDAEIERLRKSGMLREAIAERVGLTVDQVRRALGRLGLTGVRVVGIATERRAPMVEELKTAITAGASLSQAAKQVGVTAGAAAGMLSRAGVRVAHLRPALPPARNANGTPRAPRQKIIRATPKQLAALQAQRTVMTANYSRRTYVPPPSREEAERAVAEFLAKRSITVCPSPVVEGPNNFGVGFR